MTSRRKPATLDLRCPDGHCVGLKALMRASVEISDLIRSLPTGKNLDELRLIFKFERSLRIAENAIDRAIRADVRFHNSGGTHLSVPSWAESERFTQVEIPARSMTTHVTLTFDQLVAVSQHVDRFIDDKFQQNGLTDAERDELDAMLALKDALPKIEASNR